MEKLPQIRWLPAGTEPLSKFQQWYYEHGDAWNAKRKYKYHTDPAYREKVLASQQERNRVRRVERQYRETLSGKVVRAYSPKEVSAFIGKPVTTLYSWSRRGFIPGSIFVNIRPYYTATQINLLGELSVIMIRGKLGIIDKPTMKAAIAAHRIKIFQFWSE